MRGHRPCLMKTMVRLVLLISVLLACLTCVNGISYRCENNQVLIVQSFGNDTIRMHCQRLHLCGYEKMECGYDHEQPNCGGKLNFVAHVNQITATGPVQHTCCELKLANQKQNVPGHDGNDCFVYELPDGTHDDKKSKGTGDDITVLKNVNQIAEQFEGGNVGYRMRLFMLKNKSPPTLIVKAIERVSAGYKVTICRPRCGKFSKEGEVGQDVQAEEVVPSHPKPIEGKEQWTAGKDGNDYQALQWGSWSSSTWETWKLTESAEEEKKKAGALGGTRSRLSRVRGKGDKDGSDETPTAIASASASSTSGADTASGASGSQSKKGDDTEKRPQIQKGDHSEKQLPHQVVNNNNINVSAKGGKGGHSSASINLPNSGGNDGGRRKSGADDDSDSLGKRPSNERNSAHDAGDDANLKPIEEDSIEANPDSDEDSSERHEGKKGTRGRQHRVHHVGKTGGLLDGDDDSEEEPSHKKAKSNGKTRRPSKDDENLEGPSDNLGNESPDTTDPKQKSDKNAGKKDSGKNGPLNKHKSKLINEGGDDGQDSSAEPNDNNGPSDTDEDLTSTNKSNKSKGKGPKSDGKPIDSGDKNVDKDAGKSKGSDEKSKDDSEKPIENGDGKKKLDGDIENKKSKLDRGKQAHSEIPDDNPDSDSKSKPKDDDSGKDSESKPKDDSEANKEVENSEKDLKPKDDDSDKDLKPKDDSDKNLKPKDDSEANKEVENSEKDSKPKDDSEANKEVENSEKDSKPKDDSEANKEANELSNRKSGGHDAGDLNPDDNRLTESNPDGDSPNEGALKGDEEGKAGDSNIKLPDQRVKTNIETPDSSEEVTPDHGDTNTEPNNGDSEHEGSGQGGDEDDCAGVVFGGSGEDEDESGFGSGEGHKKDCGNKKKPDIDNEKEEHSNEKEGHGNEKHGNGETKHTGARAHGTRGHPKTKPRSKVRRPATRRQGAFVQERHRAHSSPVNRQSQADDKALQWEDSPGRAPAPSCFSGDTRVETSEGEKLMKDLQVGDNVLVPASGNTLRYERVAMFYHREPETRVRFVRLETENGKTLALTALHLLPFGDCTEMIETEFTTTDGVEEWMRKSRFAHKAQVGDCLLTLDSQRTVQVERIVKVGREYSKGIYSPMTVEGSIITNDILSSCFSQIESHAAQKMAFDVIMMVYSSFGYLSGMAYEAVQEIPMLLSYFHQFSWYLLPFAKY